MRQDDLTSRPAPRGTSTRGARPRRRGIGPAAQMGLLLMGAFVLLGAVGAGVAVAGFVRLTSDLPSPTILEEIELPQQSVIYDRTGKIELARFGTFNREVVTFDEVPPVLVDATTAVEDRTFWDNAGLDTLGIVSAALDALRGQARGASTITQQLVRQRLLTTSGTAQTQVSIERKLREVVQSVRVTQAFPGTAGKQRIMAAYLNQNYYGNDAYGVKAAAERYFGVELKDLTLAQAAILAAIPKAPTSYDLVQNAVEECVDPTQPADSCTKTHLVVPQDAPIVQRRNLVLDLMEQGRTPLTGDTFTAADFDAARREPVVLAPQASPPWIAPQFVWQVRRELAAQLCGPDVDTCPTLERGGLRITSTLDVGLQRIAEKWVKAATIVPHAKDPRAAAKQLGLKYESWMANLRGKSLRNGALVALDYQTGDVVAYVGSADATATRATAKFQPRFDVLSDGWRQPGSAFKPLLYATGIDSRQITAASMFMDVVTNFGAGYTPTDADNLERGPVRVRNALQFSLNIPAVKALQVIGNDRLKATAEAMGVRFLGGKVNAGAAFALGVEEVHPVDLAGAYGTIADGGQLAQRTTIISVEGSTGNVLIAESDRPEPRQVLDPGAAGIVTDILADNTRPGVNPYWGQFEITDGGRHRPATLKTGTNNDARDLNAYGYIAAPSAAERRHGEYALVVGTWNGNSDNSLVSTPSAPLFSIDVTTYVWHGFLEEATRGWSINAFKLPAGLDRVTVDAWTGLRASGGSSVRELFLAGTAPGDALPAGTCGEAVLAVAGFERDHGSWMDADRGWLRRAERGPGVRGGPKGTRTAYFYNGAFAPYGRSWGPLVGGEGCASPSPSPSVDPCATPLGSPDPSASPWVPCPAPESPSEVPSETPAPTPTPTATPIRPPTPPPTAPPPTPPPPTPTATPAVTPASTPTATPTPTPAPAAPG